MPYIHFTPVIKTGPSKVLVIHLESQGMYKMQTYFCGTAKPGDITGVGRYLRLVEHNVEIRILYSFMFHFFYRHEGFFYHEAHEEREGV